MIEVLREFRIFDGMEQKDLEQIAEFCKTREIAKGSTLFAIGDPAEFLFLLKKGSVELCCQVTFQNAVTDVCIEQITKGQAFGLSALTHPFKYHLTAHVVEDAGLIEIKPKEIRRICAENSAVGYKLMDNVARIIGRRVSAMERTVRHLIQQSLKDKESTT